MSKKLNKASDLGPELVDLLVITEPLSLFCMSSSILKMENGLKTEGCSNRTPLRIFYLYIQVGSPMSINLYYSWFECRCIIRKLLLSFCSGLNPWPLSMSFRLQVISIRVIIIPAFHRFCQMAVSQILACGVSRKMSSIPFQ